MTSNTHFDLYYWCTPNGDKALIMFEELKLNYTLRPINILKGVQYEQTFLAVSPNNKIPAIQSFNSEGTSEYSLFESGAILLDLAERYQQLIPAGKKREVLQWLFWQVGGLGPMAGQTHHFNFYAPEVIPYAKQRYINETRRLYSVLEQQLTERNYIVDEFSIADIACYPWIECHSLQEIDLSKYPNVETWLKRIRQRPSVIKTKALNQSISQNHKFDESARQHMFK